MRTERKWYLVLANTGRAPARNVRFVLTKVNDSGGGVWFVIRDAKNDGPDVDLLAPYGDVRFTIVASMGSALQVNCVVTWDDDRGEQKNVATLRLN